MLMRCEELKVSTEQWGWHRKVKCFKMHNETGTNHMAKYIIMWFIQLPLPWAHRGNIQSLTPSTSSFSIYTSPSSILLYIPLQSSSYSVCTPCGNSPYWQVPWAGWYRPEEGNTTVNRMQEALSIVTSNTHGILLRVIIPINLKLSHNTTFVIFKLHNKPC
jgi:hypothetical protein